MERESQKGASAIEYVMIIAVLVVAIAGVFSVFAGEEGPIQGAFDSITSFLEVGDGS
ncbi:MAG: Flp family type IVb pilin [Alcanivorax sp.]|nr:Flp family type IVb pilin [Alcanivorax sp.]